LDAPMLRWPPCRGNMRGRPGAIIAMEGVKQAARPTPIWACQVFSFVNSIGTAVMTNGIYFVTQHGYGFSRGHNYVLGVLLGVTYIIGALGIGPALRWLEVRWRGLSTRAVLIGLMLVMGALCLIPWMAMRAEETREWPVWVMILLYSPLTGVLWP